MNELRVLVDTGPLVALLASSDSRHRLCVDTFESIAPPLLTCWPVLTEAAWLLRKQHRPIDRMFDMHAAGLFAILPLDGEDLGAIAEIMRRYESARVQFADASLAHLAEREDVRTLFTLDRRDFSIIRLRRGRALRLLPAGS